MKTFILILAAALISSSMAQAQSACSSLYGRGDIMSEARELFHDFEKGPEMQVAQPLGLAPKNIEPSVALKIQMNNILSKISAKADVPALVFLVDAFVAAARNSSYFRDPSRQDTLPFIAEIHLNITKKMQELAVAEDVVEDLNMKMKSLYVITKSYRLVPSLRKNIMPRASSFDLVKNFLLGVRNNPEYSFAQVLSIFSEIRIFGLSSKRMLPWDRKEAIYLHADNLLVTTKYLQLTDGQREAIRQEYENLMKEFKIKLPAK